MGSSGVTSACQEPGMRNHHQADGSHGRNLVEIIKTRYLNWELDAHLDWYIP